MIWAFVGLLVLLSLVLLSARGRIAQAQSNLAGGRVRPGCVTAEALFLLGIAAIALTSYLSGWLSP